LIFGQTTTAFRINYDQALLDLPGNATESLTSNQYVFAGTNVTFLPYGTVTELDANGDLIWSKSYSDGSFGFQLNDIKKDQANSEYYVCGGSESNAGVFMRLDATGNVLVSTRFEIAEADGAYLNRVIKTSDGGYIAAGYVTGHDPDGAGPETYFAPITYTDNNGDSQTDIIGSPLLVKFDANGNHLWHHVTRYYTTVAKNPADRIYNDASFRDVVETADGYMAVGQYDVNQHRSNQNSDGDDATPTDALIFKTDLSGSIVYHRQVDNPSTSTSQGSKFLSAINKTSVGDPIAAGGDDGEELVMKYGATGAFSLTFSQKAEYSSVLFVGTDPVDVSQIYEVNGGTDLVTMGMYIRPLSFEFSNSLHRMNASANATVWAKKYTFGLATILPRGQQTSDGGFLMTSTTSGISWDYQVIKTDPNGDTPLLDCPPGTFSPSHSGGPTTIGTPHYNAFSGTPGPSGLTVAVGNINPTQNVVCRTIECVPPPIASTVTATPSTICAGQSTTITASGPGTNVSYNVYDAATGGTNLGIIPLTVSPGTTTSYYVETIDNADPTCVSTTRVSVTITVNPSPTVTPSSNSPICVGENLNVSTNAVTGGTYSWTGPNGFSSGAQNPTINNAVAAAGGTYSLTVTANGCSTGPITTDVIVSPTPTATAGALSTTICSGQNIELTANMVSGGSYSWTGPNGFTSSIQNPIITGAGVNADGTYSLEITIGSCTSNTSTVDVTVNPTPTVNVPAGDDEICVGETVTITPTSGGTWSSSDPSMATITNGGLVNGISAGTADMTFTVGTTGCSSTGTAGQITVNPSPTINVPAGDDEICIGETVTITPTSGGTWSSSDPSVATITNGGVVDGISAGTANMTFTDGTTGCSSTGTTGEITVNPNPTINIPAGDEEICQGETVTITPTSGGTWSSSDPSVATITNGGAVDGINAGTADMTFIDAITGCSNATGTATIIVNAPPTLSLVGTDISCYGAADGETTVTPSGNGPFNYNWSPSGGNGATASGLDSGMFTVTVTDDNGCESDESVTINEPIELTLTTFSTQSQCTIDDGTATVSASGGTGTYTYLWTPSGQTTATATGIGAGSYNVVVTDDNNCTANATVVVESLNGPTVTVIDQQNVSCIGANDGFAEVEATGGTPGYSYSWSPSGGNQATTTGLGPSTYTVEVTDNAGCTAITSVDITSPDALTIDETIIDASCGQTDGGIVVNVSGGTPSYTYDWTPNVGNTSTIGNLSGGSYDLTVTDVNGCQITQSYSVGVNGTLPIDITPPTATIDAGESVDLIVETDPGVTGESYTWTPAEGLSCTDCPDPNAAPDETTTYYVEVTTADGCSAVDSIVIVVDQPCGELFVPTIFSPNNDDNNDMLCVYGGCISALEFQIYNRWGELIFTTNDNSECWDGTQNGDLVNTGVYVYKLNVTLSDGEEIQESGNINLVK
jgi:gliding motility-associated-like protein